jgi:allantoin racemase
MARRSANSFFTERPPHVSGSSTVFGGSQKIEMPANPDPSIHLTRRLLVINSNSNALATERIQRGLAPHLRPGTTIACVNAAQGPQGIDTALDVAIAAVETAKVVAAHRSGYDAYIVACGADPGIDACRQIVDQPVIGITEAALLMACTLGYTFSLLTTLTAEIPSIEQLVGHYGMAARLASVRAVEMTTADLTDRELLFHRLAEGAQAAVRLDRAEVIVLTGSIMVGLETQIATEAQVPVLAGLVCAYHLAEGLAAYGQQTSRAYKYRRLKKSDQLLGYPELQNVYSSQSILENCQKLV